MSKLKILVVEDEVAIREGLVDVLTYHGYEVCAVDNGNDGSTEACSGKYDLVVLDVMLPGKDGFTICNEIRERDKVTPVLMLTAKSSEEDIVNGLSLGADDYVAKPFSIRILVLRIEALLRRTTRGEQMDREIRLGGHISIDTENFLGTYSDGATVEFSRREIELLQFLRSKSPVPASREELLVKVWGYADSDKIETRTVDIHVAKLRRKIESNQKEPEYLVTIRGKGYRLDKIDV